MNNFIGLILWIPGIIIATTLHEFTRAVVSTSFGDRKPKEEGRLTLNPLKHFEPIGFILMFATGFGWGKPVNTSALYYKDRKKATLITAIAPSIVNILAAIIFMFLYKFAIRGGLSLLGNMLALIVHYNVCLFVYNFIPVTPMDGMKVLSYIMPSNKYFKYLQYEKIMQMFFLLFLFMTSPMGTTNVIFSPIVTGIQNILSFFIL